MSIVGLQKQHIPERNLLDTGVSWRFVLSSEHRLEVSILKASFWNIRATPTRSLSPSPTSKTPSKGHSELPLIPFLPPSTSNLPQIQDALDFKNPKVLRRLFGLSNDFKEGDQAIQIASASDVERYMAREILNGLRVGDIKGDLFIADEVTDFLEKSIDQDAEKLIADFSFRDLKQFLLSKPEEEIRMIMPGLRSEAIAGVAKIMTNEELTAVASKVYNSPPGFTLGAKGYFGSRIQPNSPTDDPLEVLFSALEGLSYGCGDAVLGINIVASDWDNVKKLEETLMDVVDTFDLRKSTKWCVLAHIDDQMAVHHMTPGVVDMAFQSIGGTEAVNRVFNVSIPKLVSHLKHVQAQYFETGQGSAVTNKADGGIDLVTCEARAHGLARALGKQNGNYMIVNTVAGFIGPEVFRTAKQLLRACLEDVFMGKLHGLCFGIDICSTYHMSLSIDEMTWIQNEVLKVWFCELGMRIEYSPFFTRPVPPTIWLWREIQTPCSLT